MILYCCEIGGGGLMGVDGISLEDYSLFKYVNYLLKLKK